MNYRQSIFGEKKIHRYALFGINAVSLLLLLFNIHWSKISRIFVNFWGHFGLVMFFLMVGCAVILIVRRKRIRGMFALWATIIVSGLILNFWSLAKSADRFSAETKLKTIFTVSGPYLANKSPAYPSEKEHLYRPYAYLNYFLSHKIIHLPTSTVFNFDADIGLFLNEQAILPDSYSYQLNQRAFENYLKIPHKSIQSRKDPSIQFYFIDPEMIKSADHVFVYQFKNMFLFISPQTIHRTK
jgi:hypothetical protein